jgi:hypothetical protein
MALFEPPFPLLVAVAKISLILLIIYWPDPLSLEAAPQPCDVSLRRRSELLLIFAAKV